MIKALCLLGADVSVRAHNGWLPIHSAANSGHIDATEELLRRNTPFMIADYDGYTPLHLAAISGSVAVLSMLLNKGHAISPRANDGRVPLHCAALHGNVDAIKLFLEKGVDVSTLADDGEMPLHCAAGGPISTHLYLNVKFGGDFATARGEKNLYGLEVSTDPVRAIRTTH
ncbi:ankyrin repeat protein, putative [Bodo saltans]|uniref:Ankyrin repeat protein, putative n=1 Tax=Bodo saltans TaxID=75058 RepID=A0A0S4IP43_BODSA|nr:ankyrin repeat protein, putative [Bodo saltans]|eukprot:CUE92264.1 ankyrin repeat protein, putative [Bodo saltans]